MEDAGKSGFKILNIVLMDSSFKRVDNVHLATGDGVKNNVDITTGYNLNGNMLVCNLTVNYTFIHNEIQEVEAKIVMVGVFEKIGDTDLKIDSFGQINAPSIIFPYIREHLTSLSVKAGVNPVVLAPVNFVAMAKPEEKKID